MEGIQCFLFARDVTAVDHPSLALPDYARQFGMHAEVERAVRDEVWNHKIPWTGCGVGQGKRNPWGWSRDGRHFSNGRFLEGVGQSSEGEIFRTERCLKGGAYILLSELIRDSAD